MSSEELAFELVYERSDEATRIVMDLRRRGYSNTEIADITGTGIKRIQLLLTSISEEYEAAVAMAETTCWNTQEKELFLKLIIANRTTYEDVDLAGGGLSDDPDALARVAAFREAWFRVGTSTEPADRPRTEAAIARVYAVLGTSRPRFVWCDSPMAAQLLMYVSWGRRSRRRSELWSSMPPALRDALGGTWPLPSLGVWMGDALGASMAMLVYALQAAKRDWLTIALKKTVPSLEARGLMAIATASPRWGSRRARDLVEPALQHALLVSRQGSKIDDRTTSRRSWQGTHWVEVFLFNRDLLGISCAPFLSERLDLWVDLARSCMWWWPYRNICVLSERPAEVHSPDGQHLHNDAGPAIRFRDGWCVWAINGVPVDEEIVLHPETQSLRKIRGEQNAEVKRIRIERYGWDRYLAGVRAVVIDRSRNDIEATAETLMRGPDGETVLVCACPSTARVYALPVPSGVRTCTAAQAWLSGGLAGRIINGA